MRNLYTAHQVKKAELDFARSQNLDTYVLMQRAGKSALNFIQKHWPEINCLLIVCGSGNNGGDGYELGHLALKQGFQVLIVRAKGKSIPQHLDGAKAQQKYLEANGELLEWPFVNQSATNQLQLWLKDEQVLLVDAILGSGLHSVLKSPASDIIQWCNSLNLETFAIDVPSGLDSDTGAIMGTAISAKRTLSFVALKRGCFTGDAKDYVGEIDLDALGIDDAQYLSVQQQPTAVKLQNWQSVKQVLRPRMQNTHKNSIGSMLLIGGHRTMAGAILLAAKAALRCGAGYVTVFSNEQNRLLINSQCPEAVFCSDEQQLKALISRSQAVGIGPGLGQDLWSQQVFSASLQRCLDLKKPMVIDADAIHLLSGHYLPKQLQKLTAVLTPHLGEANAVISNWRLKDEKKLSDRFHILSLLRDSLTNCEWVLKGSGSLISDKEMIYIEQGGNSGMAVAGMGDVLTGMISAFIAQGYSVAEGARLAVSLHAFIGDKLAETGSFGMIPSDIIKNMREALP